MKGNTTWKFRRAGRKAHRGQGHPSRIVFIRMLRLGRSSQLLIDYAKVWGCPVCAASQMLGAPHVATSYLRRFGFNETVVVDLKYVHDVKTYLRRADDGGRWQWLACGHTADGPAAPPRCTVTHRPGGSDSTGARWHLVVGQGREFEGARATSLALTLPWLRATRPGSMVSLSDTEDC